nr:MAG TPA: hypothetical protein [Caudoviricetes sp.]
MKLEQEKKKQACAARRAGAQEHRLCGRRPVGIHRVPGLREPCAESRDLHGSGHDRAADREYDHPSDGKHGDR